MVSGASAAYDMADYANSLARSAPVRFATPWLMVVADNLSIHKAKTLFSDALKTLLHCNLLRGEKKGK